MSAKTDSQVMRVLPLTGFSDMVAWYADMPSPDNATYERYSPFFHPVIISFTELPASNDIIRPAPNPVRGPARGKTRITWESVFADKDGKIVENFKKEIGEFYSKSLRALRKGF